MAYVNDGSGSHTAVDTGVAPNMGTTSPGAVTDQFKISRDGSGGWNFCINGTLGANIASGTTGLPSGTAEMSYMMVCDAQSTYEAQLYIASMQWWDIF